MFERSTIISLQALSLLWMNFTQKPLVKEVSCILVVVFDFVNS